MTSNSADHGRFDLFPRLSEFSRDRRISLRDPQTIDDFMKLAAEQLGADISSDIRMYGHRTEAMFQDLVLSLGEYELLKVEDAGDIYPPDLYKVPDFRVVLPGGEQWLIEVKNVHIEEPFEQVRSIMTADYRQKLERYAAATGADLKLAVFWSRWRIWTLVALDDFTAADGTVSVKMTEAAKENDLGRLGDRWIGTRAPLRLRFLADPAKTRRVSDDGTVEFTVGGVEMYCGDVEITDSVERNIVWLFMQYGSWEETEHPIVQGDALYALELQWEPSERNEIGFDVIGSLSTMFSHYYLERTTTDSGEVIRTRAQPHPDWFEPLAQWDYDSKTLPLWLLTMRPSSSFGSDEVRGGITPD